MKVRLLGTGTSLGVPIIGCRCGVCTGGDPRNQRLRASVLLTHDNRNIVIDTTPDFRSQCLCYGVNHVEAVLLTHAHADHIHGLDDIRPFNFISRGAMPVYCDAMTEQRLRQSFAYMFTEHNYLGGIPKVDLHRIEGPFETQGLAITPVPLQHGTWTILGFRAGTFAYCTDTNGIPEASYELLRGLDVLVLDCLQYGKHVSHFCYEESLAAAARIGAKQTWLTHMSHEMDYATVTAKLPRGIALAYDGLEFEV